MAAPRDFRFSVLIGKPPAIPFVETPVYQFRGTFGVNQPIAQGSITLRAPRPTHVQPGHNILVYAGYDGSSSILFNGRLADDEARFNERGGELTIDLEGWSRLLAYKNNAEVGFNGPMALSTWWRSMCNWRGVPLYLADNTTDTEGDQLMLGANTVKGTWLPIRTDRTPLSDMTRRAELFGYRHFDTPSGVIRLQRVSGMPTEDWQDLPLYTEGQNVMSVERAQYPSDKYNVVDVRGAEYADPVTDEEFAIRSFTGTYTPDPDLGPDGVNTLVIRDDDLDTQALADAARNAHEIDHSGNRYIYRWTAVGGDGQRVPGEQVAVMSGTVNGPDGPDLVDEIARFTPRPLWLMRLEHNISERGWTTTMEGWAGLGTALPGGNDCTEQTLMSGTVHLGNEYLWHYRVPNPNGNVSGLEHHINFTVPSVYTTASIYADAHGTNSFVRNQESTASRFEIWQGGERKMSGEMPRQNENLERRYPYSQDQYWSPIVVPLSGSLAAGSAQFRIISGRDSDVGDHDDFEVKNVRIRMCGVGTPEPVET